MDSALKRVKGKRMIKEFSMELKTKRLTHP